MGIGRPGDGGCRGRCRRDYQAQSEATAPLIEPGSFRSERSVSWRSPAAGYNGTLTRIRIRARNGLSLVPCRLEVAVSQM